MSPDANPVAPTWKTRLQNWADAEPLRQHEAKILLALTLVIGAVVGLVVVGFILVTENLALRMYPAGGGAWRGVLMPIVGALVAGFLLKQYFPDSRGSGIPQTKAAFFIHKGFIRLRTTVGKFVCSSISLASGIALGREGPAVQVGAGIASGVLEQCLAGMAEQDVPDPIRALLNSARRSLDRRGRPRSYDDATESNILLAEQLWAARAQLCEASGAVDEPLARVLARLEQQ